MRFFNFGKPKEDPKPEPLVIQMRLAGTLHSCAPAQDITTLEVFMLFKLFLISTSTPVPEISQLAFIQQHRLGRHFAPEIV